MHVSACMQTCKSRGVWGNAPPLEIRCSEIASEVIFEQKQSYTSAQWGLPVAAYIQKHYLRGKAHYVCSLWCLLVCYNYLCRLLGGEVL